MPFPPGRVFRGGRDLEVCSERNVQGGFVLDSDRKQALRAAKEIVVKFIEIGRISPNNFSEFFPKIYDQVLTTIQSSGSGGLDSDSDASRAMAARKKS